MRRLSLLLLSFVCWGTLAACQHAQFSPSEESNQQPWSTPERWERNAGNPFGAVGGLDNLQRR